ncbi:MAG: 1,4-dihydroxy-2-naphthoate octaprenyltransferase [SAR202 cluster bacterium]|nr:1,4-dihydroxy-2-naphthoate octaprenyltransferase [SAR202 cluster bacterium]
MSTKPMPRTPEAAPRPLWKTWLWASRPFSLTASVVPVLVGSAYAAWDAARFRWWLFALALIGSVAIQAATNLTDEYADFRKHGAAKFAAPHKVIQQGLLSPRAVLLGMGATFGVGIACGLAIVAAVGWPILAVGIASVAIAYLYSAGPLPIGNLGLGELTVFVFMGVLMVGASYFVQAQALAAGALLAALPVAFLVTSIMHCNNLRDIDEDRAQGKRSIATWVGLPVGRRVYAALLAAAHLSIVALAVAGLLPAWALLALLTLPLAVDTVRGLWRAGDRMAMNRMMVRTARLHFLTGVLLAVGLAVAAFVER